jgi:hypothetical protein
MEYFTYNTQPKVTLHPKMATPAPLFSSEDSYKRIVEAKQKNGNTFWDTMRVAFEEDYKNLPLQRFKVWGSVMTIPFMTRAVFSDYVRIVLNVANENDVLKNALVEPMVGMTEMDYDQFYSIFHDVKTTMNRIQHAAHLIYTDWVEDIKGLNTIIDIGSGIGEMADIVYKLGFKGKYIIYDFPEVIQIQKWHHKQLGLENIEYISNYEELKPADLCISTWALTEMPLELRENILNKIGGTKNWLIAYSNLIFNLDNDKYIAEDFVPKFNNHNIEYIDIPFMNWDGGTKYLSIKEK